MANPNPDRSRLNPPVRDSESARALAALNPRGPRYGRTTKRVQVVVFQDQIDRLPGDTNLSDLVRRLIDAHLGVKP